MTDISNNQDVIDSRDIIERIDCLQNEIDDLRSNPGPDGHDLEILDREEELRPLLELKNQ